MAFRSTASYDLGTLDAQDEATLMVFSKDFRNAIFTVIAADSASCTIKFYGSNSDESIRPVLTSAASASNEYSSVQVVSLSTGNPTDGDTGLVYAGSSDGITRYEINENGNNWLGVKMTARAAGSITLKIDLYDNQ